VRYLMFCLAALIAAPIHAFEIEDQRLFGSGTSGQVLRVLSTGDIS
jgi:poly(3-hydroxybutyrate) depolymerase